jgi:circadian clock protein KaiC
MCCSAHKPNGRWRCATSGTDALRGRHAFRITDGGIVVYPRIEALLARPSADDRWRDERCATGVNQLDAMLGGGIPRGTTALVLGASGSGKTSLGLYFLSRSSAQEPGLFFDFYEMPLRLRAKAAHIGIKLDGLIEQGHLEFLWHPPTEDILYALGNRLLEAVRRRRVKRLVIDGLLGFQEIAADRPHRIGRFLTALANALRVLNVTLQPAQPHASSILPRLRRTASSLSTLRMPSSGGFTRSQRSAVMWA